MRRGIIRRSFSLSLPRSVVSRTVAYWASFFWIGVSAFTGEPWPAFEASGWHDAVPSNAQSSVVLKVLLIMLLFGSFAASG